MKRGIVDFVAKCPNRQQVKVEHQKPGGMTQGIDIATWKWEVINMDFITGLSRIRKQHDSIWVIVDRCHDPRVPPSRNMAYSTPKGSYTSHIVIHCIQ